MESMVGSRDRIVVRQVKEWGEILADFECRNRFEILDESGTPLGFAAETGEGIGAMVTRNFLGRLRPSTIRIMNPQGKEVARGEKRFSFYFHRMELYEGERRIGAVGRKFSLFHRKFVVEDASGEPVLSIVSPWFRIWTFKLFLGEQEVGRIAKKWGGFLREAFTDADSFAVEFSHPKVPLDAKKLLLLAVFLVDFTCFENNQHR
jgi:uncharacterized protein YxjI